MNQEKGLILPIQRLQDGAGGLPVGDPRWGGGSPSVSWLRPDMAAKASF